MTAPILEEREIGRIRGAAPGPTVILVAGIHGNEHAGVTAARRVLQTLERRIGAMCGELVAFGGNLGAMRAGRRYLERDLNRMWNEDELAQMARTPDAPRTSEERERAALDAAIRDAASRARGRVHLVDLHTTSAPGLPFVFFGDTLKQRHFVSAFPLPVVLGLEDQVDGALPAYWTRRGFTTCGCEGGQHDDPSSIDNLEALALLAVESAGLFGAGILGETRDAYALLDRLRGNLPRVLEVVSRHAITPEDRFVMEPGFANLCRAKGGQLLARDRTGEIRAPKDGIVMLPLYQGQGSDGFFWGREVSTARLRVSEALRHVRLERFLSLLPGVRRDPERDSRFVVSTRVARLYPLDTFHMLGYRRVRHDDRSMTVERQPD